MADWVRLNEDLVIVVESMLRDGTVEGLARQLRHRFPDLAAEAEAAIGHGVEKLVVRQHAPEDSRAYVAACAFNEMKRVARTWARQESLEALAADPDDDRPGWEPPDAGRTAEDDALIRCTYDVFVSHVSTWDTENVRVVTLLYLEAAYEGEPLPSATAAQLAGELLGYEVDPAFVRTWKSRGFKKLRAFVAALDAIDEQREEIMQ